MTRWGRPALGGVARPLWTGDPAIGGTVPPSYGEARYVFGRSQSDKTFGNCYKAMTILDFPMPDCGYWLKPALDPYRGLVIRVNYLMAFAHRVAGCVVSLRLGLLLAYLGCRSTSQSSQTGQAHA
jgi:hypothetical protein